MVREKMDVGDNFPLEAEAQSTNLGLNFVLKHCVADKIDMCVSLRFA